MSDDTDREAEGERRLQQLFAHVRPRVKPPADDEAEIRRAVLAEWEAVTGRRIFRRRVGLAAAATGVLAAGIYFYGGKEPAIQYLTGYLIEKSLSVDNIFVMVVIFSYFGVPALYQHRVLFWGILGALVMRGTFIIDPEGVLRNIVVQDLPIGRSIDDTIRVLSALQHSTSTGDVCPADWGKGKESIKPSKAGEWFEKHAK